MNVISPLRGRALQGEEQVRSIDVLFVSDEADFCDTDALCRRQGFRHVIVFDNAVGTQMDFRLGYGFRSADELRF